MTHPTEQAADAVERELADLRDKLAVAVEAIDYLLRVADEYLQDRRYPFVDVHLMVEEGAKIQSVADARAALAQINTQG